MPRPRKCRRIAGKAEVVYFKPQGIPMRELVEIQLTHDGFEALRLADLEGLNQGEAAQHMGISRHTFGRLLAEARRVTAEALVNGLAIRIQGGDYTVTGQCRGGAGRRRFRCADGQVPGGNGHQPIQELNMKKIAISCEGPTLDDAVDPRFGRAGGFLIVDVDSMDTSYLDNGQTQMMAQGAGIQAAEQIARAGAGYLLTGYVGPKAFTALSAAGVKVIQDLEGITAREAVERFKNGQIEVAEQPNSASHGGMGGMGGGGGQGRGMGGGRGRGNR